MLMVFLLVPSFDPVSGILFTLSIAVIPGFLKIWYPRATKMKQSQESASGNKLNHSFETRALITVLSFLAALGQLAALGT